MEALFGQAKKLVMETVGLQSSLEPDAEFSKWMENLKKLESMNHLLRKHFSSYASSMVAMGKASNVLATEIASFYANSENRKKSVKRFADAHAEIESASGNIFQEQFGWEVLHLFDKWLDDLAAIKQRIRQLDELRHNAHLQAEKVADLRGKVSRMSYPAREQELRTEEAKLTGLQHTLEQGRSKMRELVKLQIDNRYAVFDGIFVRLMECQSDFFRACSGLVDGFEPNISNYRKLYPRGSMPASLDLDEPASASASASAPAAHKSPNGPAAAVSQHFDDDHHAPPHLSSSAPSSQRRASALPSSVASAPAAQPTSSRSPPLQPQQQQQHHSDNEDDMNDFPSFQSAAPKAPTAAPQPIPSPEEDFLGFSSPSTSAPKSSSPQPRPSAPASSSSDFDTDFFFGSPSSTATASPAPVSPSVGGFSAPPAPSSQRRVAAAAPTGSGQQTPKTGATAAANKQADDFDFLNLNAGPSKSSGVASAAASSAAPSTSSASSGFDFDFGASSSSSSSSSSSKPKPAAPKAADDFDNLFGAAPSGAPSSAAGSALSAAGVSDGGDNSDAVQARVDNWAMKGGAMKNLRALILSLNEVSWPGCSWQPVNMQDLMEPAAVKRAYRKTMVVFHPDKVPASAGADNKLLAERVFDYLTKAWNQFQVQERV